MASLGKVEEVMLVAEMVLVVVVLVVEMRGLTNWWLMKWRLGK